MKLKYLSLCVLGLSFSGCSSHVIKSNSLTQNQSASERAIQAMNAIYAYPDFDYRGEVKLKLAQNDAQTLKESKKTAKKLDPDLQQKLDQYLKQQNIKLSHAQKQALFQSMSVKKIDKVSDIVGKGAGFIENILNDSQFSYDGTVNYRQKIATFNLDTKYQKPNLLVQVRIPSVIDFKDSKFYTNIFSIMPYLANTKAQSQFAYYDFSKYKKDISNIDAKALVEFLKQSGATTYILSPQDQIKTVSLSAEEKSKGAVEKIRIQTSVEELMQQAELYALVNRQYFMNSVLKIDAAKVAALMDQSSKVEDAETDEVLSAAEHASEDPDTSEAEQAMSDLHEAVNRLFNEEEEGEEESTDEDDAVDATATTQDEASSEDDQDLEVSSQKSETSPSAELTEASLTEEQCNALTSGPSKVRMGDLEYCNTAFDIDLLTPSASSLSTSKQAKAAQKTQLTEIFTVYDQGNLVDAEHFKQLWNTHLTEIDATLPEKSQRTPLIIDISLDAQGRATQMDYDATFDFGKLNRQMNVKFDLQIRNYGNATKIDRQALNQALPFKDAFKGSLIETFSGVQTDSASGKNQKLEVESFSWEEQLQELATKVYLQTGSYEKTYKAIFIAKLTAEQPEIVKYYSAQDLQEIAAVYAFRFSDEEIYNLKGEALKQNKALQIKHQLILDGDSFDEALGGDVDSIVTDVIETQKTALDIQKLSQQYKSAEAIFAQYYVQKYEVENELEASDRADFQKTAKVLAKAFVALKAHKFNSKMIQSLDENALQFIDYGVFRDTYQALLDAKIK